MGGLVQDSNSCPMLDPSWIFFVFLIWGATRSATSSRSSWSPAIRSTRSKLLASEHTRLERKGPYLRQLAGLEVKLHSLHTDWNATCVYLESRIVPPPLPFLPWGLAGGYCTNWNNPHLGEKKSIAKNWPSWSNTVRKKHMTMRKNLIY